MKKNSFNSESIKLNFGQYYISQAKRYSLNNKGQFEITEFSNTVIEVFPVDDIIVGYMVVGKYNNNNNTIDYIPEIERVQNIGYIEITKDGVKKAHIKAAPAAGNGTLEEWIISDDFETIESKYILNSGIGDYINRPTVWISHFKKLDI